MNSKLNAKRMIQTARDWALVLIADLMIVGFFYILPIFQEGRP